MKFNYEMKQY